MCVTIDNVIYVAQNLNHLSKLQAIADMAMCDTDWTILNPDIIRSIAQYVKSV